MYPQPNITTKETAIYSQGFVAFFNGDDIVQGDVYGNQRNLVGKTIKAYEAVVAEKNEAIAVAKSYYDKLVELGIIEKEKTVEELAEEQKQALISLTSQNAIILKQMQDMQKTMAEMMGKNSTLNNDVDSLLKEDITVKGNTLSIKGNVDKSDSTKENLNGNKSNTTLNANGFKSSRT